MRRTPTIAVSLAYLAMIPVVARAGQPAEQTHADKGAAEKDAVPRVVRTQKVGTPANTADLEFTGVVRPRHESDLAFRASGKVVERLVEVGTRVASGQPLARLDTTDYQLAVEEAEADLAAAEADRVRTGAEDVRQGHLLASGSVTVAAQEGARAGSTVASARAERAKRSLQLARNRLAYCTLAATFSGVVTALPVEPGQVVAEGQAVVRVAKLGELEAVVPIPENALQLVQAARATATFWANSKLVTPVTLRELSPTADPVTRTYLARYMLPEPEAGVTFGMTTTVHVRPSWSVTGYPLPLSALARKGDHPAVYVVASPNDTLELRDVDVVQYRQDNVVIGKGLAPGDTVVTAGIQKLQPGMLVRPWSDVQ